MFLQGELFFIASLCFMCFSLSFQGELGERFPRQPGRPRPHPPPPVDSGFMTDCEMQKRRSKHIECVNSSFASVQCMGPRCFCVDPRTGERINSQTFPERERASINCTGVSQCPERVCVKICRDGYQSDQNECQQCECNAPPPSPMKCDTINDLVQDDSCSCDCVTDPPRVHRHMHRHGMARMSMCPTCNATCNTTASSQNRTSCVVTDRNGCPDGTNLRSVGPRGKTECVPDLVVDQRCMRPPPRRRPGPLGADQRMKLDRVEEASVPCRTGLECREVDYKTYTCKEKATDGVCVIARMNDSSLDCDGKGLFNPLQCHDFNITETITDAPTEVPTIISTTVVPESTSTVATATDAATAAAMTNTSNVRVIEAQMCRCVEANGTVVNGTEVTVRPGESVPVCRRDYENCQVAGVHEHGPGRHRRGRPKLFYVLHGENYFDAANCRTCECRDGNATEFCSAVGNCTTRVEGPTPSNCTLEGEAVIRHDETMVVGCETCGCKDGRLRCTKKKRGCGTNVGRQNPCDMCKRRPPGPVCGPDGRNHPSHCTAVQCAGIPAVNLQEGPCQSQDACEEHPCRNDEVCINKRGTVACIGPHGCAPHHLRTCVNPNRLNCPVIGNDTDTTPSSEICGPDNVTYQSLCHLIQSSNTVNIRVRHAGPCECQTNQVCGSDGLTYDHACDLRSQAAVRVDYPGQCISNATLSLDEICQLVLSEERCVFNSGNCDSLVFPDDGCCPICGGAVQIVLDVALLADASDTNPDLQVVDLFALQMMQVDELEEVFTHCTVEVTLTETGSLQLVFEKMNRNSGNICYEKAQRLEQLVNEGLVDASTSGTRTTEVIVALPQAFSYAMAASAAPQVVATDAPTSATTSKGAHLEPVCLASSLALVASSALLLFFY